MPYFREINHLVAYIQAIAVVTASISEQCLSVVTAIDSSRIQVIFPVAFVTSDMGGIAISPMQRHHKRAVGTDAVVCPWAVEVGAAYDKTYGVAGSHAVFGPPFPFTRDDMLFLVGFLGIALYEDMDKVLRARSGAIGIDPCARIGIGSKENAGGMLFLEEEETAVGIAAAYPVVLLGTRDKEDAQQ
jgi:hypothetical protein